MTSAVQAQGYVKRMLELEGTTWGNLTNALEGIERRYGIPYWTLNNLRTGRAKTVEAGLFKRLQRAYYDHCERQISRLQHELEIEKARDANDLDADLLAQVQSLAEKVKEAKGRVG
ncbi:hypothetical protein [Ensifer adhaerens]|uniref:hypothetical protein n=1 Tax=Ensifer adhaerens TaxID=106592 RepID=UPI000CF1462E|nr:hypothetical protein [Ensifer adhaerens]